MGKLVFFNPWCRLLFFLAETKEHSITRITLAEKKLVSLQQNHELIADHNCDKKINNSYDCKRSSFVCLRIRWYFLPNSCQEVRSFFFLHILQSRDSEPVLADIGKTSPSVRPNIESLTVEKK